MKKKQEEVEAARNAKNLNKDFQTCTTVIRWKSVNVTKFWKINHFVMHETIRILKV